MARGGKREGHSVETPLGRAYLNKRQQGGAYWRISRGKHAGKYLHRVAWEQIAGRPIKPDCVIHHMMGKDHFCGPSLIELPKCLHPSPEPPRDPYTGEFLSLAEWQRRYGSQG